MPEVDGASRLPRRPSRAANAPVGIVHVIHNLNRGGTERRMLNVLAGLDRSAFTPLLCCVDHIGQLEADARRLGLEPLLLGRSVPLDPRSVLRLARLVRRERAQIVHGWLDLANAVGRAGGWLGGAPVLIAGEGGIGETDRPGRRAVMWRTVERALASMTDAFVANSSTVAEGLRRRGAPPEKIEVIRSGVVIPRPLPAERLAKLRRTIGVGPDERLVGMVARLDPRFKDHPTLLRAFARLLPRFPDARLAVVGDGPAQPSLERLAQELGIAGAVTFAGLRLDAFELMATFDVAVLCSFSEGFSNVVLESMAWGLPVVTTDLPANREAIEDEVHGLLVPVGDVDATASAIERVLDGQPFGGALGQAARARAASEFSLAAQAEQTMALYERLLARHRLASRRRHSSGLRRK